VSDESGPPTLPNFNGLFVGVCGQDGARTGQPADIEFCEYCQRDDRESIG
jgi:hypothetical protein